MWVSLSDIAACAICEGNVQFTGIECLLVHVLICCIVQHICSLVLAGVRVSG